MPVITEEKRAYAMPRFTRDPVAVALIRKITTRAIGVYGGLGVTLSRMDTEMDLSACHAGGCPLNLDKLLAADDFNLMHDITGIYKNLDRETGKLMNCFLPRCHAQTSPSFPRGAGISQTESEVRAKRKVRS